MKYMNKKNNKVAELIKEDKVRSTVMLQYADGSNTTLTTGTFKRWWKAIADEAVNTDDANENAENAVEADAPKVDAQDAVKADDNADKADTAVVAKATKSKVNDMREAVKAMLAKEGIEYRASKVEISLNVNKKRIAQIYGRKDRIRLYVNSAEVKNYKALVNYAIGEIVDVKDGRIDKSMYIKADDIADAIKCLV